MTAVAIIMKRVIIINWKNVYNKVTIDLHDADGIMDFKLAKGIDQMVKLHKPQFTVSFEIQFS
jgi:hypothetical protein